MKYEPERRSRNGGLTRPAHARGCAPPEFGVRDEPGLRCGNAGRKRSRSGGAAFTPLRLTDGLRWRKVAGRQPVRRRKRRAPSNRFSRNDAMDGAPPSRRLTAWESPRGQIVRALLVPCSGSILGCGKSARSPRWDGVSRRDGGGPSASLRLSAGSGGRGASR